MTNYNPKKFEEDKLDRIFELQKQLDERILDNIEHGEGYTLGLHEERVSGLCTAIIHESVELQRLTNWKWWKKDTEFDTKAAKEECIDIWHFLISLSIKLGMTPADILNEYERKNKINHKRQEQGY